LIVFILYLLFIIILYYNSIMGANQFTFLPVQFYENQTGYLTATGDRIPSATPPYDFPSGT